MTDVQHENYKCKLRDRFTGQIAAAIVSTIHSEADYNRLRHLAKEACADSKTNPDNIGLVSEWIAWQAHVQADALIEQLYPST